MNINNSKKINSVQNSKGLRNMDSKKIPAIIDNIKSAVQRLYASAERRVPENMSFAPVLESFQNSTKDYSVKEFVLKIIADPVDIKNSRRVLLEAEVPNSDYIASLTLAKGKKADLLKEISEESFSQKILELLKDIDDAVISFERR